MRITRRKIRIVLQVFYSVKASLHFNVAMISLRAQYSFVALGTHEAMSNNGDEP